MNRPRRPCPALAMAVAIATVLLPLRIQLAEAQTPPTSGSRVVSTDIVGSDGTNDLRVTYTGNHYYTITDQTGIVGCIAVDSQTVSCFNDDPEPVITFLGNGGNDRAFFAGTIQAGHATVYGGRGADTIGIEQGGSAQARFFGDQGDDRLTGASASDSLVGDSGSDRLMGRSGADTLTGGTGADSMLSGAGDDLLRASARGEDVDREIRCGAGDDTAIIDRGQDPKLRGCEHVRLR